LCDFPRETGSTPCPDDEKGKLLRDRLNQSWPYGNFFFGFDVLTIRDPGTGTRCWGPDLSII
jgi:hypothetical protein